MTGLARACSINSALSSPLLKQKQIKAISGERQQLLNQQFL